MGINDQGQVTGYVFTPAYEQFAFLWDRENGLVLLDNEGGFAEGHAINEDGAVAGVIGLDPVRWETGQPVEHLGHIASYALVNDILEDGSVVGGSDLPGNQAYAEACVWESNGGFLPLGIFSTAGSVAADANENEQLVGWSSHAQFGASVGVVWNGSEDMVDLNAYANEIWVFSKAVSINESGDILAMGRDFAGVEQAVVLWAEGASGVEEQNQSLASGLGPLRIVPNPVRNAMELRWRSPASGEARIGIFDATGRRVASLGEMVGMGDVSVRLDPTGWPGSSPAAGVYYARVYMIPAGGVDEVRIGGSGPASAGAHPGPVSAAASARFLVLPGN